MEIATPAAILLYPILRKTHSSQHQPLLQILQRCSVAVLHFRLLDGSPGFYLYIYKEPAYSAADVAGDCTGADTDRLIQQRTRDRTFSCTAQQEHIISGPNIGMIRHVHHEHIHAHTADNRTDMTTNGFSPCFYSKAFLMSHSSQTVNLFCTLFFCLFRPDKSSRL